MQSKPRLSVAISAHNRAPKLARALEQYKTQTLSRELFEMVLINDGSTDETGSVMRQALETLRGTVVDHGKNLGAAAARNSAIGVARGEYILFVNDDTYPSADYLEQVLSFQDAHKGTKAVGLGVLPFIPELQQRLFYQSMYIYNLYTPFTGMEENKDYPFDYFIGTGICFPRAAFVDNQIYFDEGYVTYGAEDIEIGVHLHLLGYRVRLNPKAVMYHDHEMSVRDYRARCKKIGRNLIMLCRKFPALRKHYLGAPQVTPDLVEGWRKLVAGGGEKIEQFTNEIDSIRDLSLTDASSADRMVLEQLVHQVGPAMHQIFEYETRKSFIETLEGDADLLNYLRSMPAEEFDLNAGLNGSKAAQPKIAAGAKAEPRTGSPDGLRTLDTLITQAETEIESGDLGAAKLKLNQVVEATGGADPRALNDLAVVAMLENNLSEAERLLKTLRRSFPDNGPVADNMQYFKQLSAIRAFAGGR